MQTVIRYRSETKPSINHCIYLDFEWSYWMTTNNLFHMTEFENETKKSLFCYWQTTNTIVSLTFIWFNEG